MELKTKYVETNRNAIHLSLTVCMDLLQTVNVLSWTCCLTFVYVASNCHFILHIECNKYLLTNAFAKLCACVVLNVANLPFFFLN